MRYEDLVKDFVNRTRENLELVRSHAQEVDGKAYEVTQFINSLFGLLILPQQEFFDRIPRTPVGDLEREGWPIPRVLEGYEQVSDLAKLARYLRNGISHCNIKITEAGQRIDGLIIWNDLPNGRTDWKAELKISELDTFARKFTELLLTE